MERLAGAAIAGGGVPIIICWRDRVVYAVRGGLVLRNTAARAATQERGGSAIAVWRGVNRASARRRRDLN
jgi:hypothetical protein